MNTKRMLLPALAILAALTAGCHLLFPLHGQILDKKAWQRHLPETPGTEVRYDFGEVSYLEEKNPISLTIEVPQDAKVAPYRFWHDVADAEPGDIYELTAFVKTEAVQDGLGASISLGPMRGKHDLNRVGMEESLRLTGDNDWTTLTCRGGVAEKGDTLRVMLLLHGTGQAWYDQVHLEKLIPAE